MNASLTSLVGAGVALVVALALGPPVIGWLRRGGFGSKIREDTPEAHLAKKGTPSMGGIFLVPAVVVGTLVAGRGDSTSLGIAATMLSFSLVGSIDDIAKARRRSGRGILARTKFAGEILFGVALALYCALVLGRPAEVQLLPLVAPLALGVAAYIVWGFLAVWTTNSVNLTDGLDGLATGLMILATMPFLVRTVLREQLGAAAASAALLGGCVGFLVFNRRPAKVFMGDTGSLGLGGAFVALSVYTGAEWLLLLAGLPFVLEGLSVVIQVAVFQVTKRIEHTAEGRRVFRKSPLHHHFEEGGTPEPRVVLGFWLFGLICSVAATGLVLAEWMAGKAV